MITGALAGSGRGPVRAAAGLLAVAAVLAVAPACSDHGGTVDRTPLLRAIGSVKDSAASRAFLEWADLARIRSLSGISPERPGGATDLNHARWARLFGAGTGSLSPASLKLRDTGLDLYSARAALQIGQPPRTAVRVDGLDTDRVGAGLVRIGGHKATVAGRYGVVLGADGTVDLTGPLTTRYGLLNQLDQVAFDGDRVASGAFASTVADTVGDSHTLRDDKDHREAADCLGDVLTATLLPAGSAGVPAGVVGMGIGVRTPSSPNGPAREVVCLVSRDSDTAGLLDTQVGRRAIPSTMSDRTGGPWSRFLSSTSVSRVGSRTVRLEIVDRPDRAAGLMRDAFANRDLASLLGP